ncbi:hypothetical protein SEA_LILPHARAOH_34 [Mycobacterium phage LilPharaoh]|uniref:Uncharacterized protein n=1 Tax=Mycobacterium phage Amelie TaxID=1913035 RepID=A0A1J0GQ27_9CAUD|nr:hypothetical protein AVV01_gp34 [Mycobacterium phage Enkosi]YP_009952552.1 hypothetical protein I5G92_gp34 [Mycobacterium phage Amelie]ATN90487.1 hypothetical protein SEA_LILPHARAOH_34 [Mycobacterium phage LilPharaoh]AVP42611.1 hypothetical protein SEA_SGTBEANSPROUT_34 [Mycobacterium phage SgtBeansprout]AXC37140.1 hypothetical protein SEA_BIGLEBOPS_34 [Mycobacterium phage Biglebops]QGJ93319.1 hypothetical protein PBI_MDAVU_34 [Mycobacterium phage Mdavu]UQS94435.1 hypothetical protein SEA_N
MSEYTKDEAKAADRILADLYATAYRAEDALKRVTDRVHRVANDKQVYYGRSPYWKMSIDEALAAAAKTAEGTAWFNIEAAKAIADYPAAKAAFEAANKAIRDHEDAHYKGWLRFFLVQDGHIHRSTYCSSLRPTTRISWLPELSGETEAEAVAAHGAMLCTKCFPSAPVEWTRGKVDPNACPGGGKAYVEGTRTDPRRRTVYGECSHCHTMQIVTMYGVTRKHKLPKNK